jgi:hypothetical protein
MALLNMPLRTMWSEVQEVRERVQTLLAHLPEDVRAATVMTASELVENAIKYGESVPGAPEATVALNHDGEHIEIIVKNGVAAEETVRELRMHVDRLAGAPDRMALYIERLRQLMTGGGDGSKLGLYRIGCEGGFDLHCDYTDRVVTMTATRRVA